jgi:hypothetical protein
VLRTRPAPLHDLAVARLHGAPARRSLPEQVLALQRTAGNRVVRRMLQRDTPAPKPPAPKSTARAYPPWDRVWIGHNGLLGEVVANDVTVRMFRDWKAVGIEQAPEPQTYECGPHDRKPIPDWVKKMRDVARLTAAANAKLPAGSPQRVAVVGIAGDSSSSAYRIANGRGLVVVGTDEFDSGAYADTLLHETAHALYEHHSVRKGKLEDRVPDALALRIADLYSRLDETEAVPIPTGKFDASKPPRLDPKDDESGRSAGHVMVMDTLWAGAGGHPWGGPDEFFASAYGAWKHDPALLKKLIAHYAKKDKRITDLGKELLELLPLAGDDTAADKLKGPADPKEANRRLTNAGAPLDITGRQDVFGWLVDPEQMPGPAKILCPSP